MISRLDGRCIPNKIHRIQNYHSKKFVVDCDYDFVGIVDEEDFRNGSFVVVVRNNNCCR